MSYGKPTIEDIAEAERLYPTNIKTQKCIDCGRLLLANEYGGLYCPKCFDERVQEMIEETNGGYY